VLFFLICDGVVSGAEIEWRILIKPLFGNEYM